MLARQRGLLLTSQSRNRTVCIEHWMIKTAGRVYEWLLLAIFIFTTPEM